MPVHHAIGNHCLSVKRQHLRQRLGIPESYYSVLLVPGWRLIVLDTTEMSGHSNLPPVGLFAPDTVTPVDAHSSQEEHAVSKGALQHQV